MTINSINTELQIIAQQSIESRIEEQYNEFLEEMYEIFAMEEYAMQCYDRDAEFYGAM